MLYQVVHVENPKVHTIVIELGYLLTDLYSPQIGLQEDDPVVDIVLGKWLAYPQCVVV